MLAIRLTGERRRIVIGLLFVSPWIVGFSLFGVYPLLSSLYYSFTHFDVVSPPQWAGLANYVSIVGHDSTFRQAVGNTLYFTCLSVVVGTALALGLATLLNSLTRLVTPIRLILFLPSVLPLVAGTILWLWVLNPQYGIVDQALRLLRLPAPGWFASPTWAVPGLVLLSVWSIGPWIVIYLAALQGLPNDVYEAARIDGAGALRMFGRITVPLLSPIIVFNVVLNVIAGLQVFTQGFIAGGTSGAPGGSLLFLGTYIYDQAFVQFNMGYASALAWLLFAATGVATIVVTRTLSRYRYYEI